MARPALLILDEPCAGLDPVARERFLEFVEALGKNKGAPAVLVTHHVEEIMPIFSHVLMLRDGQVAARGPKGATLTGKNLRVTFGADLHLKKKGNRYQLGVRSDR